MIKFTFALLLAVSVAFLCTGTSEAAKFTYNGPNGGGGGCAFTGGGNMACDGLTCAPLAGFRCSSSFVIPVNNPNNISCVCIDTQPGC